MTIFRILLLCAAIFSSSHAGAQTNPSTRPSFDSATGLVSIPDVVAANQHYGVELRIQPDSSFRLTNATSLTAAVSLVPATYDFATGMLDIPKLSALGRYYSVRLKNRGNFDFDLVQASEIPLVSNMVPWTQTGFRASAPAEPRHVNRVVTDPSGRIHAAWYTQAFVAYMSYSDNKGATWQHTQLDRMTQIHQLIRMNDGTLVAGGQSVNSAPMLWYSQDSGKTWRSGASGSKTATGLPNATSSIIWDLAERQGRVIITTSAETNSPGGLHQVVYEWTPSTDTLRPLASLQGMGALAVAVKSDGTIIVSTQDSAEHDDPATAGEGRLYRSADGGASWTQTGTLPSANRIYALTVLSDGSLVAGSGLNGGFYYSRDGNSWALMTTLPSGQKLAGVPAVLTNYSVTRVYKILELASGTLLVSTGNETGDIFVTCDQGNTWIATAETGNNNVAWGLAQATDGTIWIGNGSVQGDIWSAAPPTNVTAQQLYSCW